MKKILIIALAILAISSCNDPYDPNEATRNPLLPGGDVDTIDHRFSPNEIMYLCVEYFKPMHIQWVDLEISREEKKMINGIENRTKSQNKNLERTEEDIRTRPKRSDTNPTLQRTN